MTDKKQNPPSANHLVPRMYLKNFADSNGSLQQAWIANHRTHRENVKTASVINDFYNLKAPDGTVDTSWEKFLGTVEGAGSKVIRKVLGASSWVLSKSEDEDLAVWIAVQYLRSLSMRRSLSDQEALLIRLQTGAAGIEHLRKVMETGLERKVSDEELEVEWADLTQPNGPEIEAHPLDHLAMFQDLLPMVVEVLLNGFWVAIQFKRKTLLTSDTPVTLDASSSPRYMGVGIANADGFVLPLGRRTALMIQSRSEYGGRRFVTDGTTAIANSMNHHVIGTARKWVLCHPDDMHLVPAELPKPIQSEVVSGSGKNDPFISREGIFANFTPPPRRISFPDDEDNRIPHYTWPIPRRKFVNPHIPKVTKTQA